MLVLARRCQISGLGQLQLKWVRAVVCGLVANNVVPVADIVGRGHPIVAANVVPSEGLIAGRADYDCGPLHV